MQQVVNLVRAEMERQTQLVVRYTHLQVSAPLARKMIIEAAALLNLAATCPAEQIEQMGELAARCQSHRYLQKHCGGCEEYDKAIQCPACGGVAP